MKKILENVYKDKRTNEWVSSPLIKAVKIVTENSRVYYNDLLMLLNSRSSRQVVLEATKENEYVFNGEKYTCTIFNVDGSGYKRVLSIDPSAAYLMKAMTGMRYEDYTAAARSEMGTNKLARERAALSTRCTVAATLFGAKRVSANEVPDACSYIPVKRVKKNFDDDDKRTRFSQMRGVFVNKYNTPIPMFSCSGLEGLIFHGFGEEKMIAATKAMFPAYPNVIDTCIIVGDRYQAAMDTLRGRKRIKFEGMTEAQKDRFNPARVTELYRHIIFATMDEEGINTLRLFAQDPTGSAIARFFFPDIDQKSETDMYYTGQSLFEYDVKVGDNYYVQALTGDIAKLWRIAAIDQKNITIYCFPGQVEFLEKLFEPCKNKPEISPLMKIEALMESLATKPVIKDKYPVLPGIKFYKRKKDC